MSSSLGVVFNRVSGILDRVNSYLVDGAFKNGAEEASDVPVVFIDPKKLPVFEFPERRDFNTFEEYIAYHKERSEALDAYDERLGEALTEQLEDQMPGATEALIRRYGEGYTPARIASDLLSGTPAAISDVMVGGKTEVCVVYGLDDNWDSTTDVIYNFVPAEFAADFIANTDVSNLVSANIIGGHEGEHCNKPADSRNILEVLREEIRADRGSIEIVDTEAGLFWRDLRRFSTSDSHATAVSLNSGEEPTAANIYAAKGYVKVMYDAIDENFDFDAHYKEHGEMEGVRTYESFLKEDPEAYFEAVNKGLEEHKSKIMEAYKEDPSLHNTGMVLVAQEIINHVKGYENTVRRNVLGQDLPEPEFVRLIPQEAEDQFFEAVNDIGDAEFESSFTKQENISSDFLSDDATYVGDPDLVKEASEAGIAVNSDLIVAEGVKPIVNSEPSIGAPSPHGA
jgi:hypothetical protein